MKILIVEDDERTADYLSKGLKQEGYCVTKAEDGEVALECFENEVFDLAIIDIMMPRLDGIGLLKRMRKIKNSTPAILLSAKTSVDDRIKGLEHGGDDYISKPFSFAELLARVQAIMRRSSRDVDLTYYSVADLTLDVVSRKVKRNNIDINLPAGEFTLLEYLMRNSGRVMSKTMIAEYVWGFDFDPGTNVIETRISRLRDKIDRDYNNKLIRTVKGFGYTIEDNSQNI